MGHSPYWDEWGEYHNHDPNWNGTTFRCSQGHQWTERWLSPCPVCEYGRESHEVTYIGD